MRPSYIALLPQISIRNKIFFDDQVPHIVCYIKGVQANFSPPYCNMCIINYLDSFGLAVHISWIYIVLGNSAPLWPASNPVSWPTSQCSQTDNHEDNFAQINFKMSQDVFLIYCCFEVHKYNFWGFSNKFLTKKNM